MLEASIRWLVKVTSAEMPWTGAGGQRVMHRHGQRLGLGDRTGAGGGHGERGSAADRDHEAGQHGQ